MILFNYYRDWVKERTYIFDYSRDILEELMGAVDIRSRVILL